MLEVQKYIRELLLKHDVVIVPNLGGFITQYKPAVEDMMAKKILPPSRALSFNKQLCQNDGLLIQHIAQQMNLSYKLAEDKVTHYVSACKRQLEVRGIILLPEIGKLYLDGEGNMLFAPETARNYLPAAFGLKPVAWHQLYEKVHQASPLIEEVVIPKAEIVLPKHKLARRKRYKVLAGSSFAVALALVVLMAQGLYVKPLQLSSLSVLNIDLSKAVYSSDIVSEPIKLATSKVNSHYLPALMPEADVAKFHDQRLDEGYYLVLGSFETEDKANKFLKRQQFDNELVVLNGGSNKYRVATFATTNTSQALASLNQYRKSYRPDVWLMFNLH